MEKLLSVSVVLAAFGLMGCDRAPEGGWKPYADLDADAVSIVPADGPPVAIVGPDGRPVAQPLPRSDGSGLQFSGVDAYPGSRFGPVELRRVPAPRPDGVRLFVTMKFAVDAPPDTVLDWYAQRLAARKIVSQRDGNILNAALPDRHLTIVMDESSRSGEIRLRRR